ncbi:MAG: hypothetical protein JXA68_07285 [Ignavibacteriales bacterium]|nr:hypothetical protein [Ignavibacteriales bacterium]
MKKYLIILPLLLIAMNVSFAQFGDGLGTISSKNAEGYIKPIVTSYGIGINSGTFNTAYVPTGFSFSLRTVGMYLVIPDDQKLFTPQLPSGYVADEPTATIYGDHGAVYPGSEGYVTFPGGLNISNLPFAMVQLAAGFYGTELMVRYLPEIDLGTEKLNFWGIGFKHMASMHFPMIPVDVSLQFFHTSLNVSEILDIQSNLYNLHVSKEFIIFTPYLGLQLESTHCDLSYTIEGDPASGDPDVRVDQDINLSLDGENTFRATFGVMINLAILKINVDYGFGAQGVATVGLTLGI